MTWIIERRRARHRRKTMSRIMPEPRLQWWQDPRVGALILRTFRGCLLPLHVTWVQSGKPKAEIVSGWLVVDTLPHSLGLLWVTAGHALRSLVARRDDPDITELCMSWYDGYPNDDANNLPANIADLPHWPIDHAGIDMGFVQLRTNHAANLGANPRIQPLTQDMWRNKDAFCPRGFFVLGFPAHYQESRIVPIGSGMVEINTRIQVMSMPLRRVRWRPTEHVLDTFWGREHSVYAELALPPGSEDRPQSMLGFSGAPVFSVRRLRGEISCHVWGVQSAELGSSGIIRATNISVLDAMLQHLKAKRFPPDGEAVAS